MFMLILFKLVQTICIFIVRIIHNNRPKKDRYNMLVLLVWFHHHSQARVRWMKSVAPESRQASFIEMEFSFDWKKWNKN